MLLATGFCLTNRGHVDLRGFAVRLVAGNGLIVTPDEWGDILDLIHDLWPSRKSWPEKAADRCYRQLKMQKVETVKVAVERLVGERPPSPASLQVKVAEVAAVEARYGDRVFVLPSPGDEGKALKRSEQIRGGKSWQEWLEETNR